MRYLLALVALLGGCGDKSPPMEPDLAMSLDEDMAKFVGPDMVRIPEDMTIPPCGVPPAGIYNEYTIFGYRNIPTGPDANNLGTSTTVIVQPDGAMVRPLTPITNISLWHCTSAAMASPSNCQAPCCDGSPQAVPIVYFAKNGWTLFRPGQCIWTDPNQVVYYVDVQQVSGTRVMGP
jgi:hypothetical protein